MVASFRSADTFVPEEMDGIMNPMSHALDATAAKQQVKSKTVLRAYIVSECFSVSSAREGLKHGCVY